MRFTLIAVGTRMPAWVAQGYEEYRKRLPAECALVLKEIPLAHRAKNADVKRALETEGEQMLAAIGAGDAVVALDVKGKSWSTEELSGQLQTWQMEGCNVSLLVGGPDGLSPRCVERAHRRWSLSALTLPHPLVRIVLAEQLYRAWSIVQHHPYHR